ncbi:zinc finger MYM-type protein 1-like protein [Tanacetum coccineum]
MERYFKRKFPSINGDGEESIPKRIPETIPDPIPKPGPISSSSDGIDLGTLPWDPSERPNIFSYDPNIRDEIGRKYLSNGACQPRGHKDSIGKQGGNDAFVTDGFNSWSKKYGLNNHVGEVNSYHNKSLQKCELLLKQKQSIHVAFKKQIEGEANNYGIRLNLSVETCRFLLKASLPFRGHDEKKHSMNRGLFLELYELLANQNEEICKVVARTPLNLLKMDEACAAKRNRIVGITNRHYFEIDIFNTVLDMQIQEFGDRSSEISTHLFSYMSALSPRASFSMFDASKLINLTTLYPDDFTDSDRFHLMRELDLYHVNVVQNEDFSKLNQSLLKN